MRPIRAVIDLVVAGVMAGAMVVMMVGVIWVAWWRERRR